MFKNILAGGALCCISLISLIINLSVLFVLVRNFLKHNSIYVLAITNIIGNSVQVLLIFTYLGPSSMFQKEFVSLGFLKFLSYLFLSLWYTDLFFQVTMAMNRLLTVVFHKEKLFTRAFCWKLSILVYAIGFVLAYISDYVISCCTAFISFRYFSYAYTENGINYVNMYIDIPLNFASSALCFIMYSILFIYVHKVNRANASISLATASVRRGKELRYAVQFAICSLFACLAWVSFRVFPLTVPVGMPELYSFTAQCLIGHCTANSVVFLIFNQEFKTKYFCLRSNNSQVRAITSLTTNNNGPIPLT